MAQDFLRLYMHEVERTYADKLINHEDLELFHKILRETIRKNFEVNPSIFSLVNTIVPSSSTTTRLLDH